MNFDLFLKTLPIIGECLLGIFGGIGFIIGVTYLLNYLANRFADKKKGEGEN